MDSWLEIRPVSDRCDAPETPATHGACEGRETCGAVRRRAEGAAWRAIVRERLGDDIIIGYNALGAPVLSRLAATGSPEITPVPDDQICRITDDYPDHPGYIGVSHTRGWVAVVWSPEPCAVDIELKGRAISPAVRSRYSIETISDWCALEARYKYESLIGGASASESETVPGAEIDVPPSCSESAPVEVRFVSHPELVVAVVGAKMKP